MKDDAPLDRWIRNARRATGSIEVILNKVPTWASRAVRAALRRDGRQTTRGLVVSHFLLNDTRFDARLFDHWGSSMIRVPGYTGPSLVTEPNANARHIQAARDFAKWLGCEVEIGGASWWYPGSTVRIEFYPRPFEDETPSGSRREGS